jgi:hypothetical protein
MVLNCFLLLLMPKPHKFIGLRAKDRAGAGWGRIRPDRSGQGPDGAGYGRMGPDRAGHDRIR